MTGQIQHNHKIARPFRPRARQLGQSMVEYTVVSVFGILVLTTGPGGNVVVDTINAMRSNYEGYTYAVSLSDYPDKESSTALIALYTSQGMPAGQIEYLADEPVTMLGDIMNYNVSNYPNINEGPALLNDLPQHNAMCKNQCPISYDPSSRPWWPGN